MLNLDTHILLYALTGELRARERTLLKSNEWSIAAIVFWEVAKLAQLGKITIDLADPVVENVLAGITVWPLDFRVAKASTELDFQSDPADELIAATSIVHRVPLLTRDRTIRSSKLVMLA